MCKEDIEDDHWSWVIYVQIHEFMDSHIQQIRGSNKFICIRHVHNQSYKECQYPSIQISVIKAMNLCEHVKGSGAGLWDLPQVDAH